MKPLLREAGPGKRGRGRKVKSRRRPGERGEQRSVGAFDRLKRIQQQRGESLGEFAYRIMREALRAGTFRSGEHLREADVGQWLKISRTPVREAFHRLIAEGLLANGPWNGVMVAELDAQELVQLYAVREALEGTAAALAAQNASAAEVKRLLEIAASEARARNDPEKLVIINSDLHQTIYAAAHNRYLLQSVNTVVDALGLLRHSTFAIPGSIEMARRDHLHIIKRSSLRVSTSAMRWRCGSSCRGFPSRGRRFASIPPPRVARSGDMSRSDCGHRARCRSGSPGTNTCPATAPSRESSLPPAYRDDPIFHR
jgi:DNA-binding GntR family transcriptional regulator